MKKSMILVFAIVSAALSVLSASAAPLNRYYDQSGNKNWCNVDSDGCWVTDENGEHEYIMFWSEASRTKCMGEGSNAPIGVYPGSSEMALEAPKPQKHMSAAEGRKAYCLSLSYEYYHCEWDTSLITIDKCVCRCEAPEDVINACNTKEAEHYTDKDGRPFDIIYSWNSYGCTCTSTAEYTDGKTD